MAIMACMKWSGVSREQYDALRTTVNWEGSPPTGGVFHVAGFDAGGLRITDVWESAEDLERFVSQRLMPGVARAGIEGQPDVEVMDAHAVFAPGYASR